MSDMTEKEVKILNNEPDLISASAATRMMRWMATGILLALMVALYLIVTATG